jgi:hypothetical protein
MKRILLIAMLAAIACGAPANPHAAAARLFTQRYAQSRFRAWHVRATAAGRDCDVLLVETSIVLEDSMIEAMHYDGGVQRFCREGSFRGVAYKDSSGRLWTYGGVTAAEAETLQPCR